MPPHTPFPSLAIIVATTPSLGIGYYGSLPWPNIKPDLAFFARVTKRPPPLLPQSPPLPRKNDNGQSSSQNHQKPPGQPTPTATINALLMGRKTWASIPASRRPLGDRVNVIITRQPSAVAAELERAGLADGKQHVLVAGSIEEGLRRLVQEYPPPPPPPQHHHHHQSKSEDGEGSGAGDGGLREAVTDGHQEEPNGFSGNERRPSLGRVFVIGGREIYTRALQLDNCERIIRTHLKREWKCDVWFPQGVFVDRDTGGEDTNESRGREEAVGGKAGGWRRKPGEELDAWCGESVAGEKKFELDDGGFNWEVEMWGRERAGAGNGGGF